MRDRGYPIAREGDNGIGDGLDSALLIEIMDHPGIWHTGCSCCLAFVQSNGPSCGPSARSVRSVTAPKVGKAAADGQCGAGPVSSAFPLPPDGETAVGLFPPDVDGMSDWERVPGTFRSAPNTFSRMGFPDRVSTI